MVQKSEASVCMLLVSTSYFVKRRGEKNKLVAFSREWALEGPILYSTYLKITLYNV